MQRSAQAAVDWFVSNQEPRAWLYEYGVATTRMVRGYNEVRHAG